MANKPSPAFTRGRKGSVKEMISIDDISILIRESEERILSIFQREIDYVKEKVEKIEAHLASVHSDCMRLDNEVSKIKDVIAGQQLQIEKNERRLRVNNLIIQNIPEHDLSSDFGDYKSDIEKSNF